MTAEIARLPTLHLCLGDAFDIRESRGGRRWGLFNEEDQDEVRRRIGEGRPSLVIGSLPCTAYCKFNQGIDYKRMKPDEVRKRCAEADVHWQFAMAMYELQLSEGRHFRYENPASAISWSHPCVQSLELNQELEKQWLTGASRAWVPPGRMASQCQCLSRLVL